MHFKSSQELDAIIYHASNQGEFLGSELITFQIYNTDVQAQILILFHVYKYITKFLTPTIINEHIADHHETINLLNTILDKGLLKREYFI